MSEGELIVIPDMISDFELLNNGDKGVLVGGRLEEIILVESQKLIERSKKITNTSDAIELYEDIIVYLMQKKSRKSGLLHRGIQYIDARQDSNTIKRKIFQDISKIFFKLEQVLQNLDRDYELGNEGVFQKYQVYKAGVWRLLQREEQETSQVEIPTVIDGVKVDVGTTVAAPDTQKIFDLQDFTNALYTTLQERLVRNTTVFENPEYRDKFIQDIFGEVYSRYDFGEQDDIQFKSGKYNENDESIEVVFTHGLAQSLPEWVKGPFQILGKHKILIHADASKNDSEVFCKSLQFIHAVTSLTKDVTNSKKARNSDEKDKTLISGLKLTNELLGGILMSLIPEPTNTPRFHDRAISAIQGLINNIQSIHKSVGVIGEYNLMQELKTQKLEKIEDFLEFLQKIEYKYIPMTGTSRDSINLSKYEMIKVKDQTGYKYLYIRSEFSWEQGRSNIYITGEYEEKYSRREIFLDLNDIDYNKNGNLIFSNTGTTEVARVENNPLSIALYVSKIIKTFTSKLKYELLIQTQGVQFDDDEMESEDIVLKPKQENDIYDRVTIIFTGGRYKIISTKDGEEIQDKNALSEIRNTLSHALEQTVERNYKVTS